MYAFTAEAGRAGTDEREHRRSDPPRTRRPRDLHRRGATPPAVALAELEAPGAVEAITAAFVERALLIDAITVNRELSVMKATVAWWRGRGWLTTSPIIGIERRPAPPDRTRALSRDQIADLFALKVQLREKALWRMLYETCARAEEILTLDIPDLLPDDKRGRVTSKGGAIDWVHWQSGTAQLLPRLMKGRFRRVPWSRVGSLDSPPLLSDRPRRHRRGWPFRAPERSA